MTSHRDKTLGHSHTDPKLIPQENASSTLSVGQLVYLDEDGIYKPALAVSEKQSNVQGVVWSFIGSNYFYLKCTPTPLKYRFPLTKDFFNTSGGKVNENSPNASKIPGDIGQRLYLSTTVPGGVQTELPINFPVVVGHKTNYGFMYRPDLQQKYCCLTPDAIVENNCLMSVYNLHEYIYDCNTLQWNYSSTRVEMLYEEQVPTEIINIPLIGTVDITGGIPKYITCYNDDVACLDKKVAGALDMWQFVYGTDHALCKRTIITSAFVNERVRNVFNCSGGETVAAFPLIATPPDVSVIPNCDACCVEDIILGSSSSSSLLEISSSSSSLLEISSSSSSLLEISSSSSSSSSSGELTSSESSSSSLSSLLDGAWWQPTSWLSRSLMIDGQSIPFPDFTDEEPMEWTQDEYPSYPLTQFTVGVFVETLGMHNNSPIFWVSGSSGDLRVWGPDFADEFYGILLTLTGVNGVSSGDYSPQANKIAVFMSVDTVADTYTGEAFLSDGTSLLFWENEPIAPGISALDLTGGGWRPILNPGSSAGVVMIWNKLMTRAEQAEIVAATTFPT